MDHEGSLGRAKTLGLGLGGRTWREGAEGLSREAPPAPGLGSPAGCTLGTSHGSDPRSTGLQGTEEAVYKNEEPM